MVITKRAQETVADHSRLSLLSLDFSTHTTATHVFPGSSRQQRSKAVVEGCHPIEDCVLLKRVTAWFTSAEALGVSRNLYMGLRHHRPH